MNELKDDVEDIILSSKNQGHQVEQGVQRTSNCAGSGLNESYTSAFFVVKYFDHQEVTMQHTKQLNTRDIRPNQGMKKDRTAISDSPKRNTKERSENDMKYETHSKDSKEKAKLFIDLARVY